MMARWSLVFVAIGWMATNAHGFVKYVPLEEKMDEVDVPVHPSKRAKIYMPEFIHHWSAGNLDDYKIERNSTGKSLGIEVLQTSSPSTNSNMESASWRVSLGIRPVESSEEAVSAVIFYVPEKDVGDELDELSSRIDETDAYAPVTVRWWQDEHRLIARLGPVSFGRGYMIFRFELCNAGEYPYPITGFQIRDRSARLRKIKRFIRGKEGSNKIELRGQQTLTGVIKVEDASGLRRGWTLYLDTPHGVVPATFDWGNEDDRGPLEKHFALSMRVLGGAANLDDGVGIERAQWAMVNAFGLQALYGISKHLSIEATFDFVRTNAVTFMDAVWGEMTGQLDVRETSGRLLAGGMVHAGRRWIPYARAAVGARFSKRTTSMASRSESEVRAGVLFAFGGGLNLALTRRIVAGTSLTVAAPIGGNDLSLTVEAGLHLGATWDLGGPWR